MKNVYLSLLALSVSLSMSAQTVFSDDFESGLSQWTLTGSWGTATSYAYNGTHSLADSPSGLYANSVSSTATITSSMDLSTALDANIYFKTKYDIENGFDYCYVEVSIDGGSNWTVVETFNGEGNLSNWENVIISIGGFVGNSNVKIRFRWYSDTGYQADGIFIDSMRVVKSNVDNAPPFILHTPQIHYEGEIDTNYRTVTITDISGLASADLYYKVDGGSVQSLNAYDTNGNDYMFAIPPQDAGAYVDYWVEATDASAQSNFSVSDTFKYVAGNYIKYENAQVDFVASYGSSSGYTGTAMRMTLSGMTTLRTVLIGNYTDVNNPNDSIEVHVWTSNNGNPGSDLITPIMVFPAANLLQPHLITRVDLRDFEDDLDSLQGDIFIGFIVPTGTAWVTQTTPGNTGRVRNYNGSWSVESDDYHFRVVTDEMIFVPEADFSYDNTNDPEFAFTDLSINDPDTWLWSFGDGFTSTVQNPTHTYAVPGPKLVCLTASNAAGSDQKCDILTVLNSAPVSSFSYATTNDPVIDFTDLSFYNPTSWYWEFGDGDTAHTQNPSHNYLDTGGYEVCLIVSNVYGSDTSCQVVHIYNRRPEAYFTYEVNFDTVVSFTDLSSFSPTGWHWDFDHSNDTSDLQHPTYSYPATGGYFYVCLIASNEYGESFPYCDSVHIKDLVGVTELQMNGIRINPNPANEVIRVTLPQDFKNSSVRIFSLQGTLVEIQPARTSTGWSLDASRLAPGMYLVEVSSSGQVRAKLPVVVSH